MSLTIFASTLALVSFGTIAFAQECQDPYANQTIQWIKCGVADQPTLQCATLNVPVDYTNLSAGTLVLPVVRVPATDSSPKGSILTNPGGPGVSGIEDVVKYGKISQDIAGSNFHIVSFDPRGVGLSTPYTCPTLRSVVGSRLPLSTEDGLNATYLTNVNQGLYCNESEYREAGTLVGTAFTARDLMSIVNALGEDGMIRYWGSSYGTLLGATVGAMFPDKVDRMLLDGNINPTDYYHGTNEESVDDADAAQSNFFAACASAGEEYCALAYEGATGPVLEKQYLNFLDAYANQSLVFIDSTSTVYGYTDIKSQLFNNLKYPSTWNVTALDIHTFMTGSVNPNNLKRQAPFDPLDSTSDAGNGYETLTAITCGDWDDIPGNGTLQDFEDYLKLYTDRAPHNGDMLIGILYSCATWKVNAREKYAGTFTNIQTKNPVLFINGHFDPVTPLVSAQNSSSGFVGSGVLETNIAGHCATAQPSKCIKEKIKNYFQTGVLPDLKVKCDPDSAPFLPVADSIRNITDGDRARRYYEKRFEHDPDFEYPAALRDVKRDVYEVLMEKRQASALPTCTSLATGTGSSAGASNTGANANAAVRRSVGVSSLVLPVLVVVGAILTAL